MFPLDFPFKSLARAVDGDWVFDPFCGRGTTNFAARLRGLPSVGVDSSPVAVAIASAKVVHADHRDVTSLCRSILRDAPAPEEVPEGEFWSLCYHADTLLDLCRIREYLLRRCDTAAQKTLRALIMGVLHGPETKTIPSYLSNQMPRTYVTKPRPAVRFWKKRNLTPQTVNVGDLVARRAAYSLKNPPSAPGGEIVIADSRDDSVSLSFQPFKWIVTSPPYFGMRSYIPDQWLRYWFMGGPPDVTYSQDGQLTHSASDFVNELAAAWRRTAEFSAPGANLIIRFGALPSENTIPSELIKESLRRADCGWRILTIRSAGVPPRQRRQATQFKRSTSNAVEEIDVYARLEV